MIIKQGANDTNIIAWALTSTIGGVASSITMIGVGAIDILVLITDRNPIQDLDYRKAEVKTQR